MTSTAVEQHSPAALAIRAGQEMWTDKQKAALAVLGIKGASNAELAVFFHYCQRTGLDPFSRQVYGIMRREKQGDAWVDKFTIQVGIDGFRVIRDRIAERKNLRVEYEDTVWYDDDGNGRDVWLGDYPPAACRVVVLVDGRRFPSVLKFSEYCSYNKDGKPIARWATMPAHMIEKCAEANGLRRAFPNDLAGVQLDDETPQQPAMAAPPRGRVTVAEVIERRPAQESGVDPTRPAAPAATSPATDSSTAPAADDPSDLPEDAPGSASGDQLTRLHTILTGLGFKSDDRERKLCVAEAITGRAPLTGPTRGRSSKNLSYTEAEKLIDTLDGFGGDCDDLVAWLDERKPEGAGDDA